MRNSLARNVLYSHSFVSKKRTAFLKPWPNGPASGRWWPKVLKSFLTSTRKSKNNQGRLSSISLSNNRLMDVTQLALTWMAKLGKTCFDLSANLISTKLSACDRKETQVRARHKIALEFGLNIHCQGSASLLSIILNIAEFFFTEI